MLKIKYIKNQDKKHYLAYENEKGRFALKPDIVIDEGKITNFDYYVTSYLT